VIIKWKVELHRKVRKQVEEFNERIQYMLELLIDDLKTKGPAPGQHWHHYGKLHSRQNEDKRHCHLAKGHPTYVCCWSVNKVEHYIEVYYVGTHEHAPY
jgi:mRNA-degrading endonuclease RelE of RelBE toxin-antitoxin system